MAITLCPGGGKIGYFTERDACDARNKIYDSHKDSHKLHVYLCKCGKYHLTHERQAGGRPRKYRVK